MAGGVDLMIPPGTAVQDAHACYEVVVLVTVPDKPRLTSSCLNYHYSPHGRPTRAMHTGADTNEIPLREELLEGTVYDDRQGRQVNIMNETPLDEELLETKSREEEEGENEEWDGEEVRGMAGGQWLVTDDQL
jgi:hypothetical protein